MTFSQGLGLTVLRVILGVIFLMHGHLGLNVRRRSAPPSPGT
jgi:uncharacterized membrane protein YphA (DoxX/SURF4 family)